MILLYILVVVSASRAEARCEWTNEEKDVQCNLKILDFRRNSSSAAMQVPPPGLLEAKKLKVLCSDVFFFESQLRSDHFGTLDHLDDLEISFCKLRTLPPRTLVGLRALSSLTIHTHNEDWTSLQMEPDYESLVGLDRLHNLDMQLNNLHRLPAGFFCPLKNLRHIELSFNAIKDLNLLGISHSPDIKEEFRCSIPAQSLVLRHNGLDTVTPHALAALTETLKHLDLSHNQVDVLVEATFQGLEELQTIDLSFNRLASLPPKIFSSSTPNLRTLVLSNNTLGTIDLDVFANLSHLQSLNMSGNNLDENWIRPGIFNGLHSLVVLDLSGNHIARLDQGLLDDLTALQVLNLAQNKIHTIATNSFLHLSNLHILALQLNQLESLQRQTLTGLSLLNILNVDQNKLHTLHSGSLRNCTALTSLGLSHNFLTQVPAAVHHSASLESLDLSSNLLGVLKRESLQGLPKLKSLRLGDNELSRLGEGAFVEVSGLEELDLSKNRFMSLEQNALKDLKGLKRLDLSQNQLEDVNGLFTQQNSLQRLNLSRNHLLWFDYAFIPPSLQVLDIHANNIDSLGNYYALRDNYNLKYVDASINAISSLHVLSILPGTEEINLSNNTVSRIQPNTFVGKKNLVKVHLERNRLESLDMASLMVSLGPSDRPPQFFLAGNPLVCDCHLQWFHQMASAQLQQHQPSSSLSLSSSSASMSQVYPEIPDLEQVECRVLNTSNPSQFFAQALTQLDEQDFLCPYETHCLALCLCCDFLACDCQMKCPDECRCFHDQQWTANVVQCSSKNLSRVPSLVPMDVTSLELNGNNLTRLNQAMFLGRTRLKKIQLRQSNVLEIDNGTFTGLDHLELIDLGYNQLKQLFGHEFSGAISLRELYLHHNQLVSIQPQTFKHLSRLAVLRLDGNLLIEFPIWELSSNQYLSTLTLSSNWWNCECNFVRKFRMFIDTLGQVVKDANLIACNSDHQQRLGQSSCHAVLPHHHIFVTNATSDQQTVPVILAVVGVTASIFVFIVAFVYYKDPLRIWLYTRYGLRVEVYRGRRNNNEDKPPILFDALVLYSNKDNDPYINEFCQSLEPTYRLCLLHRDLAGIYTSEAFKSALEASKRHIVVVSRSFFATEWQHFQEHLPHYQKLFVIKLEDLDDESEGNVMDDAAKKFLSAASSSKVLPWSSKPSFWHRVRYHLPDPPRLPTKEGGAELDVSGVWTFRDENQMVPVKKKCSTHSSGSINDSGVYDSHSVLHQHQGPPQSFALTRSCGTNAVVHHQRSNSAALAESNRLRRVENVTKHQRSKSHLHQTHSSSNACNATSSQEMDLERPPTPPAKVGKVQRPSAEPEAMYASPPPPRILMQLASVSPDLLASLNATMTTPLENDNNIEQRNASSSGVKMLSPVIKAKRKDAHLQHHQRSTSLLADVNTPKSRFNDNNARLQPPPPHRRSVSVLHPYSPQSVPTQQPTNLVLSNPSSLANARPPLTHHHSRSVSLLESSRRLASSNSSSNVVSAIRLEDLDSRKILNMSTSQLHHLATANNCNGATSGLVVGNSKKKTPRGVPFHQRSSSTPYEGFVL